MYRTRFSVQYLERVMRVLLQNWGTPFYLDSLEKYVVFMTYNQNLYELVLKETGHANSYS